MNNGAAALKGLLPVLMFVFVGWLAMQPVSSIYAGEPTSIQHSILIKFSTGSSESERDAVIRQIGGELIRWIAPLHTAQISLPSSGDQRAFDARLLAIQSNPFVTSVETDGYVTGLPLVEELVQRQASVGQSTIPLNPVQVNDPDYYNAQKVYAPHVIHLSEAWRYTMGKPEVILAVVDSGVNAAHPDLSDRVLPGYDFVNDDVDPTDDHGHGTHIAGIIAANANNGLGSAGVCPLCSVLPVKVLDSSNVGTWSGVAAGIVYAVDHGAKVINLSLGGNASPQILQDAVAYAAEKGVLIVAAAGNGRSDAPFYPSALESVIAVSATRQDDTHWSLSNYGDWIEISAPGYAIYSTYHNLSNAYNGYTYMSGTSMASPHVAGLAGLLLSQNPNRTPDDLRRLILETADDLGEPGQDIYFGHGRLNADRALGLEAPRPKADASLGGVVWQDDNVNGMWEAGEKTRETAVTVHVWTQQGERVGTSMVSGTGEWRIEHLYAGHYKVVAETKGRVILTTQQEYTVQLAESQAILDLNFGTAPLELFDYQNQVFIPVVTND